MFWLRRHRIPAACLIVVIAALATFGWRTADGAASAQSQPSHARQAQTAPVDWPAVEQAIGKSGTMQPGDVYKFSFPRTDLQVTARGVAIQPAFALGTWVAFKQAGDHTMVMGDLVLTDDEVSPVMLALQQGGIQQTALHNHLLGETPRVSYMHVAGHGDAVRLAESIRTALALTATPLTAPAGSTQAPNLDTARLDSILGYRGTAAGTVYQFSIPRAERIADSGMEVPPAMGTATAINFQPTRGGNAAITGDFVLLGSEVNPVIQELRAQGIEVTALHSHMLAEEPRLFFMHFWANDDAVKLAEGLKAALLKTNNMATAGE
jgi:hypothetical protein